MEKTEINDLYDYGYKIIQNSAYFKFSLDSILLSDFVSINYKDQKLLDLCTGNAPIPITLSSKIKEIYAIELQPEIYKLAEESIKINNIHNIKLINDNALNCLNYFKENSFDIITCNPPYFVYNEKSIVNQNLIKTIARHEKEITLKDIVLIASKMLKNKGRFYLIHRTERLIEIIEEMQKNHLGIKKMQFCYDNKDSKCSMVIFEAQKNGKNAPIILNPIFTKDYRR